MEKDIKDILDLDALIPRSKYIKIHGKEIECFPLTLGQLIKVARLEYDLSKLSDPDEIEQKIKDALSPFIPAIKEDLELNFTLEQLAAIAKFAQEGIVPENAEMAKEYTTKKKVNSPKE